MFSKKKLSLYTLNLAQLWLEWLSFPVMYLYLGCPNLSLVLDPKHATYDLIPDIAATFIYALSLILSTNAVSSTSEHDLSYSQGFTGSQIMLPICLLLLISLFKIIIIGIAVYLIY